MDVLTLHILHIHMTLPNKTVDETPTRRSLAGSRKTRTDALRTTPVYARRERIAT